MYLARVSRNGEWVTRIDDQVQLLISGRERSVPQESRSWRFEKKGGGAAAISRSIEGALASARKVLVDAPLHPRRKLSQSFESVETI